MLASARAILSSYSFLYFPNWVHLRTRLLLLRAILSSYSFLYFPNWVHLRLGLMASQICIHSQVLAIIMVLMALWQAYRAIFWSWSFLKAILEALPLAPA